MRAFRRVGTSLEAEIEEVEVVLLASLAEQLQELLGGAEGVRDLQGMDAFQRLAAGESGQVELDHADPLIDRLFPEAYGVAELDAEFRRFTEDDARLARVRDASVVLADLANTREGTRPLVVSPEHTTAWLKTVNALRLSLSVRLGIVDEQSVEELDRLPARDPRARLVDLYDWLGFVLESLLEALNSSE